MQSKLKKKNPGKFNFELKSFDALTGEFSGYAAVFENVDLYGDIVYPGAFSQTLKAWESRGTFPRVLWKHEILIGSVTAIEEDSHGLKVTGKIWLDDSIIAEHWKTINPHVDSLCMSFGFITRESYFKDGNRHLQKLELLDDVTLTFDPVNPQARVIEAKSQDKKILQIATALSELLNEIRKRK